MTFQVLQMSGDAVAFTADSANLSITDNLRLRIRLSLDEWQSARDETFIAKRQGGDEWIFRKDSATGRLQFVWWDTGGVATSETADADVPFTSGMQWLEVFRSGTSVTFRTSSNDTDDHTAVTWTTLGTVQTTPSGSIRSTVATHVTVGAAGLGRNSPLYGFVRVAVVLDNTTVRADPNFALSTEWTVGEDSGDTASDGVNTWQLGGNAEIVGDNIPFLDVHVSVECAFGFNLFDGSVIWTDITEDVRTLSFDRGRFYELDQVDTGTASFELENFDGKYNSHNTASPYYPNIKPNVPVRFRVLSAGTIYPLWQGFVDRWPVSFPGNSDSLVSVTCSDLFKLLAKARARNQGRIATVAGLNPVAWWRFADDSDETGNGHDLTFAGGDLVEGGAAGAWTGDVATTFDGTNDTATVSDDNAVTREGLPMTWEVWVRPTGSGSDAVFSIGQFDLVYNGTEFFLESLIGTASVNNWHHVILTHDGFGTFLMYIDGVFIGERTNSLLAPLNTDTVEIGSSSGVAFYAGDISEIAVYAEVLSEARIAALFEASFEAFDTQRTDERIEYVLTDPNLWLGGVVPALDLDIGATVMTGLSPVDGSALDAIFDAVATERGLGFMTGAGAFRFQNRYYRLDNQNTAITTFNQTHYETPVIGHDDDLLFNSIEVTAGDADTPVVVEDQASIDENGRSSFPIQIYPLEPNEATDAGANILARYSETFLRLQALSFALGEDKTTATLGFLFGAELSNRYNVEIPLAGDDLDVDVYLEQIHHNIDLAHNWTIDWQLSAATAEPAFWRLGVSGASELGVTTVLAY